MPWPGALTRRRTDPKQAKANRGGNTACHSVEIVTTEGVLRTGASQTCSPNSFAAFRPMSFSLSAGDTVSSASSVSTGLLPDPAKPWG